MNPYLRNLRKIEFVITDACTGHCKHCSEGDHAVCGRYIDPDIAAKTVACVAEKYSIRTVMAFGGEPLLYPEAVYAVMRAATQVNIPKRQVITNGYFSKNGQNIRAVAKALVDCGVNELLLSVDAFHQETIPLDTVKSFALAAKEYGLSIHLQPAWLVSPEDGNPYNQKTREILDSFKPMDIFEKEGNVIFPEGNALQYLASYFEKEEPQNPYAEDPYNVTCLSVCPNGDVLGGNIYKQDILDIIKEYTPCITKRKE